MSSGPPFLVIHPLRQRIELFGSEAIGLFEGLLFVPGEARKGVPCPSRVSGAAGRLECGLDALERASAVAWNYGARDVAGVRRREKQRQVGDVVERAEPLERNSVCRALALRVGLPDQSPEAFGVVDDL
jgi:hypothetical protein